MDADFARRAWRAARLDARLFEEVENDPRATAQAAGFASAPGVLRVLGVIGPARGLLFTVAGLWMLVATVIAVRQALDYKSTWRAVGVAAIGWVVQAALLATLLWLLGGPGRP